MMSVEQPYIDMESRRNQQDRDFIITTDEREVDVNNTGSPPFEE